jgi:putative sterol carrier protein
MSVKFLTPEWAVALEAALNASETFKQAATGHNALIQQIITTADGDTHYWTKIADGSVDIGFGDAEGPDATITQSYETAVALAHRELSPVTAFMMGKLSVGGNMGMLLGLQGALSQLPEAMASIDTEY